MRLADIKADNKTEYAVKLPAQKYGRHSRSPGVFRATVEDKLNPAVFVRVCDLPSGAWNQGGSDVRVPCSQVLSLWAEYEVERAHDEALREDRERDQRREIEQRRAEVKADAEGWCHLFAGLPVENSHYDMEDTLYDFFVRMESQTITLRRADMRAIAQRIGQLQQALLSAGGGWASEPVQDGAREVVHLAPRASSTLAALEAAIEDKT